MADEELIKRLERLERDNRRTKSLAATAVLIAAALGLMAATRPVPGKITAHEFDVVDSAGATRIRMRAGASPWGADFEMFDTRGNRRVELDVDPLGLARVSLFDMQSGSAHPRLPSAGINMVVSPAGLPMLSLGDAQGFEMDLGTTWTERTGETHQTSAASITMFGNDKKHHVIWKAP